MFIFELLFIVVVGSAIYIRIKGFREGYRYYQQREIPPEQILLAIQMGCTSIVTALFIKAGYIKLGLTLVIFVWICIFILRWKRRQMDAKKKKQPQESDMDK
ncbi:MAG: hypothetical protein IIW34_06765 [Clostridia bacterium]|nr:hypothetical protein [Clostridia bacterium]